ncbi:rho GTPase-activating gacO-like protein [Trema orientale]|uniref:Rho GTPase-activating gacO-like protein n=1 Tax=Trema orientale TaxID=63057 RepID=A0A2P5E658_TREOI|nr:rho GTPase-activating gacO-like protein [Trema orientale]
MGRGRGKGKKHTVIVVREDPGSGGDEKVPAYRRRGRPQKPLNDDVQQEEETEITEEDGEEAKTLKYQGGTENGRKRKRSAQVKETVESVKEENGIETKSMPDDSTKFVGFRHIGSRRKNKPHRAAEAGVECM